MERSLAIEIFAELGPTTLVLVAAVAFVTAAIHGATGIAGGFLMAAALAAIIGVKPIVPVMSVALLISHSSRVVFNLRHFDRRAFLAIALPAAPCIVAAAFLYGRMSSTAIAVTLGTVVLASIPIRHFAARRRIKAGVPVLAGAGVVYGALSGVSIGPGMLLIPFLLGYGLAKEAFVATIAAIAVVSNLLRLSVYGASNLLDMHYLALGIAVGLITIPGNLVGRRVLRRISPASHSRAVDVLTVVGAANFFWLALAG